MSLHGVYEKPELNSLVSLPSTLCSLYACLTAQNWALSPNSTKHSLTWSNLRNFTYSLECVRGCVCVQGSQGESNCRVCNGLWSPGFPLPPSLSFLLTPSWAVHKKSLVSHEAGLPAPNAVGVGGGRGAGLSFHVRHLPMCFSNKHSSLMEFWGGNFFLFCYMFKHSHILWDAINICFHHKNWFHNRKFGKYRKGETMEKNPT